MAKIIDVILRMKDQMTGPMNRAMKNMERNARQYQRAGKDIMRTGRNIQNAGKSLTKTVTAPIVAMGAVAVKEYGEYDKQMRLVQATMGSTAEESQALGEAIKKAAADSVFGMQDAADASLAYARAGFDAKQTADLLQPAFALAAGTATDLSEVTAGLGSTMKAFGADTKEATTYADIFAKAQAQANTTTSELFQSVSKAGSMFETVGWNVKDLAVATGILGDNMISGSEAGTAFKSGLANLSSNEKAIGMLEKLGISITNADGSYKSFTETQSLLHKAFKGLTAEQKTQAAAALFGKNQMNKWLNIIKKSPKEVRSLEESLDGCGSTSKEMADALMDGPGGAIEKLKSNWDIFKKTIGETLAPVITPMIEKITELMNKFSELTDEQKQNIMKWAGIAAAVGPTLILFGKLTTGIGKVVFTIGKLGSGIAKAGSLMGALSGPGAIVVGILAAIAAAAMFVWKNWDAMKEHAMKIWDGIRPVIETVKEAFGGLFGDVENGAEGAKNFLIDAFNAVFDVVAAVVRTIAPIIQSIVKVVAKVAGKVVELAKKVFGKLKDFYTKHKEQIDAIVGFIKKAFEAISTVFTTILEPVIDKIGDIAGGIIDALGGVIDFIEGVFTLDWEKAWTGIKEFFQGIWDAIGDIVKGAVNGIIWVINKCIDGINCVIGAATWLGGFAANIAGAGIPQDMIDQATGEAGQLIPHIPELAVGTDFWRGGIVRMNEKGGEIVDLPRGSRVYPHDSSVRQAYMDGARSGFSVSIPKLADQIIVREDADIDVIADKIANRLEKVSKNLGGAEIGYQW